jgi:hypothetical protein
MLTRTRPVKHVEATLPGIGQEGGPGTTARAACLTHRVLAVAEGSRDTRHQVAAVRFWQTRTNKRISGPAAR